MLRTWPVRFDAIELTLSVRSFHVPATPGTCAWPPSRPSVPTSRATRVTSRGEGVELIDHRVDGLLELEDLAADVDGDLLGQIAIGDCGRHLGDLSRKITVDVRGEILELKDTINTMVDQLNAFASEVTRVAREVGTEGRLGGQAQVPASPARGRT